MAATLNLTTGIVYLKGGNVFINSGMLTFGVGGVVDTSISRLSTGAIAIGTGAAGSFDGLLKVSNVVIVQGLTINAIFTPAPGGVANAVLQMSTIAGFGIYFGSGVPTVSAPQGSLYLRTDGSTSTSRMYVNSSGSTTWTAVNTVA